ncbi:MAG: hypothetical protein Ta2A_03510 [Treponemataceae bacterium]|nr:MAG: hypothetical protein Ta2A_03510 [Treponemataceae bacterium]
MQAQDFHYFMQNTDKFYKTYGGKFLAIKDSQILGVYETFNSALADTLKKETLGSFLIQECFENKEKAVYNFQGNVAFA